MRKQTRYPQPRNIKNLKYMLLKLSMEAKRHTRIHSHPPLHSQSSMKCVTQVINTFDARVRRRSSYGTKFVKNKNRYIFKLWPRRW